MYLFIFCKLILGCINKSTPCIKIRENSIYTPTLKYHLPPNFVLLIMCYNVFRLVSQFFWNIWSKMKELPKNVKLDFNLRVSSKFYSNIKHLVFINRIAGIFPISVSKNGDYYCLKWSWLRVILGNVFVLIFGDYSIQHFLSSLVIVWVSAILTLVGLILSYHVEVVYNVRLKGLSALLSTMAEILTLSFTWLIGQVSTSILFKEFWKYLLLLNKVIYNFPHLSQFTIYSTFSLMK